MLVCGSDCACPFARRQGMLNNTYKIRIQYSITMQSRLAVATRKFAVRLKRETKRQDNTHVTWLKNRVRQLPVEQVTQVMLSGLR